MSNTNKQDELNSAFEMFLKENIDELIDEYTDLTGEKQDAYYIKEMYTKGDRKNQMWEPFEEYAYDEFETII